MENQELTVQLEPKTSINDNISIRSESMHEKVYHPDSEAIREAFSQLGELKWTKLFMIILPILPVLNTLYGFYFSKSAVHYCFIVPGNTWNDTAYGEANPSAYVKTDLFLCIQCNQNEPYVTSSLIRAFSMTKILMGFLMFLFGFYIIARMLQDAKLSIKLLAFKIRTKCNRNNFLAFFFFGFTVCYAIQGTNILSVDRPVEMPNPCSSVSQNRLYFTENSYPISQITFIQDFLKYFLLMGGFYSIIMALMSDPVGTIFKFKELIFTSSRFGQNNQEFLDFEKVAHEINSADIYTAYKDLAIETKKNERNKFLEMLEYLELNKKIFKCKVNEPANQTNFEMMISLFGMIPEEKLNNPLILNPSKTSITDEEFISLCELYHRLNDELSMRLWPNISVFAIGYQFANGVLQVLSLLSRLIFQVESQPILLNLLLSLNFIFTAIFGSMICYYRSATFLTIVNYLNLLSTLGAIATLCFLIYQEAAGIRNAPLITYVSIIIISALWTIAGFKMQPTFQAIQQIRRIFRFQGIESDVLKKNYFRLQK